MTINTILMKKKTCHVMLELKEEDVRTLLSREM